MTSLAGVRCPLCRGHLPAGGSAISIVEDSPSGIVVGYESRCSECRRTFSIRLSAVPTRLEVLSGGVAVAVQAYAPPTEDGNEATGPHTNL